MDEDEAPRQRVPVLHLADDRLGDEHDEKPAPEPNEARVRVADPPQEPADDEHADAEGRRDTDVHVDGVDDPDAEALDARRSTPDVGPTRSRPHP